MRNQPIGFIDSGVGGLSVIKEVMRRLPNEKIVFIGDTARNPYGNRTTEEVIQFSRELAAFLMTKKIKMLVLACNTASAAALTILQKELPIPVIGVIQPGSEAAIAETKNNEIGVIGTVSTIHSNEHLKEIKQLNPAVHVHTLAVPKFVELVEQNELTSDYTKTVVQKELQPLKMTKIDTLILGCTHYPLLEKVIQEELGHQVTLVDPAIATTDQIVNYLTNYDLINTSGDENTEAIFYTTAEAEKFEFIAQSWLPFENFKVESITLEEFEE